MCVLPGDTWTCDTLVTEPPETTTRQTTELIDFTQTSYLGHDEDEVSRFSEPVDSYYKVDTYADMGDSLQPTATPYPLIEITPSNNYVSQIDSTIQNIGLPIAIKHSEDNYLYRFINGQKVLSTPLNANNDQLQAHLQRLTQLIERLVAYQPNGIPLDRQPPATSTTTAQINPSFDLQGQRDTSYDRKSGILNQDNRDSAILSFLIKNYILKSQPQSGGGFPAMNDAAIDTETTVKSTEAVRERETTTPDSFDLVLNGPQAGENIVVVSDSLENRQYFTISNYKSIASQLTTETVELLPCTRGVRLPNTTDCTKYYSCEPNTAKIRQYSCPGNTAFNQYKRLCEMTEYEVCKMGMDGSSLRISPTTARPKTRDSYSSTFPEKESTESTHPCQTLGKHGDPTSESHYYLCYSEKGKSTDMQFRRMVCPNSLVFCQLKKVCTTRKRCEGI